MTYLSHHCLSWPCFICQPNYPNYQLPPAPQFIAAPVPMGCICPPTSEKTCENPVCPRKGIKVSASGPLPLQEGQ